MLIYSEEQINRVLMMISFRHKRRFDRWCAANPFSSNSVNYSQFSTPMEVDVINFCKLYLIKWYGESFKEGGCRNRKAIEISKRLNIPRSQARLVIEANKISASRRRREGGSLSGQFSNAA